jgi:hypothetical protein
VRLPLLILLPAILAVAGCDEIVQRRPSVPELAGRYSLTEASQHFLLNDKGYSTIPESLIDLRPDMVLEIRNLPDCARDGFGRSTGGFLSGAGTWKLEKAFLGYGLTVTVEKGGTLGAGVYAGPWIQLRGASPPHDLEITVGDPDSGETLRYARRAG